MDKILNMSKYIFFAFSFFLMACDSMIYQEPEGGDDPLQTKVEPKIDQQEPPKDSLHRLKLVFVGDIMQHGDQIRSAFDKKSGKFDYEPCFRYISPILEEADIAIGNLELTLNDKNLYSGFPRFRTPDVMAKYLKAAGFDLLVTSNNHSNDNDRHGVVHTLDMLDSVGIMHTGTFRDTAERESTCPLIFEKEADGANFRLAMINYTYGTNGIPTKAPSFVNEIDTNLMRKDIEKAKAAEVDMIIAFMHWGGEYQLNEHVSQRKLANWLWENGVDLVIGAHPHVIQPVKTDTLYNLDSTKAKTVLAAYSLGNFISNQFRPNTDIGLMFEIELVKNDRSKRTVLGKHTYIPVWRYIFNHKKVPVDQWVHTLVPCSAFVGDTTNFMKMTPLDQKKMKTVYERTVKHLAKWQSEERILTIEDITSKVVASPDKVLTPLKEEEKPFIAKVLN
jgi:poly-gamma-glutamate capsule biosynthesis protein CapA/YwtB (metallophosphatase superfamily)